MDNLHTVLNKIQMQQLYLKSYTIEYRSTSKKFFSYPSGKPFYTLAPSYYENINAQLEKLHSYATMLRKICKYTFFLEVKFDEKGNLDFEHIQTTITAHFIKKGLTIPERTVTPLKSLLPFAEYIYEMRLLGREYQLTNCEVKMTLSEEELELVCEDPLIAPKAQRDWQNIIRKIETKFAKYEHNCDITIPCIDGELYYGDITVGVVHMYNHREVN